MLKKIRLSILALFCSAMAFAQSTGSIVFNVVDDATKSSLPFASVIVTRGGQQVGGGQTDMDGNVEIKPLDPGQYDVKAVYAGYHDFLESGIVVVPNTPVRVTLKMVNVSVQMKVVEIKYHRPAVDPSGHVNNTLDQADLHENALKGDPMDMVGMMAGVTQTDIGQPINMGGSRSEENQVIIDGMKISGDQSSGGLPQNMISEVNTYIGGVPAKYGDVTGGVIEINTLNASPKFFGSAEAITSEGLDAFGYNDFNFVIGGPIWTKKDSNHKKSSDAYPSVNFILGGEVIYNQTANPTFVGGNYVTNSEQNALNNNPLTSNPLGGYYAAANYVTASDIYHTKGYLNDQGISASGNGKIDVRVNKYVTITAGGTYQYNSNQDFSETSMLFNSSSLNEVTTQNAYRGFIRLRQRFATAPPSKDGKQALIQNAYYTLQAEYGNTFTLTENQNFKNNYFDYGYVGQFNVYRAPVYAFDANGSKGPGYYQSATTDTLVTFTPGTQNPILANYTTDVYNGVGARNINNEALITQNNGLLNGAVPTNNNVYSLWSNVGTPYGSYSEQNSNHFRFTANFSATIKNNDVQVGFEYEQNSLSYWNLGAASLWTIMRQNTNLQISQLDLNNPYLVQANQYNEYGYNLQYQPADQTQFDKSLREKLGMPVNGTNWINIDQYAPSTFNINMFSANDLLNSGNSIVGYSGYGYNGSNPGGTPPTINDFFNQHDANGNQTYPIAPYQPIYIAGYLQDHFEFKSLRFDVGVRVDRFDANQPVLKDPYLLVPAKTVSEVRSTSLGSEIPGGVSGNDVVYVNNSNSPTEIVGYRNGSTWYNANGNIISDPTVLASATATGGIQPYVEYPSQGTNVAANAFTTYTPQVNVMPRISFSFPISDMASFFAHYDILTARPPGIGANIFNPLEYEFMSSYINGGGPLTNPALKPVATTDYELGFTQALNEKKSTALTLSAFYRAPKDEIESYKYLDAYPLSYIAYNNIDFGTIKGLTLAYTLSRMGDFKMRASYTLQFATGTGSGPNSGYNLANSGQPNLQIPMPLSFDQRHTLQVNLDYHFQSGEGIYDGPTIKTHSGNSVEILSNAGINMNFVASSGTPYTVQGNATEGNPNSQNVGIGIAQHYTLVGSVNGSYLPWQYRVDLKVDKDFPVIIKGKDKDKQGHPCDLQVYLTVTNLLNTENVLNVYGYTGSASNDGFLASATGMQTVAAQASPQAFIDQYKIKEQDPGYLAMPRTIKLGVSFNF